jgi:hypothetical protein
MEETRLKNAPFRLSQTAGSSGLCLLAARPQHLTILYDSFWDQSFRLQLSPKNQ